MKKKVYIVDDDEQIVESLGLVLKKENYEVAAQHDEKNVVENVKKFKPNVIILDIMFPENNGAGFEIARELRQDEELMNIPILMLSAINEKGIYPGQFSNKDRHDSWLPVNEFVEKPIRPDELVKKVHKLLNK